MSSNIIFTTIIFYFVYAEKITKINVLSCLMICSGVLCVSIKEAETDVGFQPIVQRDLILAVMFALITGFSFAVSSLVTKHYIKEAGFSPIKLSVDGMMISALMQLPLLYYCNSYRQAFALYDIGEGIVTSFCLMGGAVSIGQALQAGGKGGPI